MWMVQMLKQRYIFRNNDTCLFRNKNILMSLFLMFAKERNGTKCLLLCGWQMIGVFNLLGVEWCSFLTVKSQTRDVGWPNQTSLLVIVHMLGG